MNFWNVLDFYVPLIDQVLVGIKNELILLYISTIEIILLHLIVMLCLLFLARGSNIIVINLFRISLLDNHDYGR